MLRAARATPACVTRWHRRATQPTSHPVAASHVTAGPVVAIHWTAVASAAPHRQSASASGRQAFATTPITTLRPIAAAVASRAACPRRGTLTSARIARGAKRSHRGHAGITAVTCSAGSSADGDNDTRPVRGSCKGCGGSGLVLCKACAGSGALKAGGFHAKNHVDVKNIVGTNWTAHRRTRGWRHFEAIGKSSADKANGKPVAMVNLAATCDREITVWVPTKELKDRELWSAGWKQREELDWSGDPDSPEGAVARPKAGATCVVCEGSGALLCARAGCKLGVVRVNKQKEVVAKTEKQFKRILHATKATTEEDEGVRDMRRRVKRQLKDMSKAGADMSGGKRKSTLQGASGASDEDWGAYGRSKRDAKLERWMAGDKVSDDPEDNQ